jgi:hypothetical protein
MYVKQGTAEDGYALALQRLNAMAKAELPESCATSPIARSSSQRREVRKKDLRVTQLTGWRKPYGTTACWEHGRCLKTLTAQTRKTRMSG